MAVSRQVCPFHADEDIRGVPAGTDEGSLSFTCARTRGHPHGGVHSWLYVPQPDGLPGIEGYAAELGLGTELPGASRSTGESGSSTVWPSEPTRCGALATSRLSWVDTAIQRLSQCSTPHQPSSLRTWRAQQAWNRALSPGIGDRPLEVQQHDQLVGSSTRARLGLIPPIVVRHRPGHVLRARCGSPVADSPKIASHWRP